ncbi:proliferating cell nuclear antigen (pcna) [Candidatus Woesearchaeota archaeon]|nr:proliferating cell nuclear antigen (pcna) [Candidatus Woesearchaeota archaeon]
MVETVLKGEHMKLTLAETKLIKDSTAIIADLVTEVRFKVTKNALELVAMDPANVAMVVFKLLSSAFVEYEVKEDTTVSINLNDFKGVLRRVKPSDTMTLEVEDNKFKITLKGTSKREFLIPIIDVDEREQKIPELNFTVEITTSSERFAEAIEDADIVGESVVLAVGKDTFIVSSSSDLSQANVEIPKDDTTKIKGPADTGSKYSIEYLKRMIPGGKLSDNVEISFSRDYPLKVEYKVVDKMDLMFILAPRVDND